jgi:hypothetical protein
MDNQETVVLMLCASAAKFLFSLILPTPDLRVPRGMRRGRP